MASEKGNLEGDIFLSTLFKGKKFLITGASSGIGAATAILLSNHGAEIIITGRNLENLRKVRNKMNGSRVLIIEKDLSLKDAGFELLESLPADWMPLNGFFHSAGNSMIKPMAISNSDDFDKIASVSLRSALSISRAFFKKKYFADESSIVFISSIASVLTTTGMGYYSAIKASINSICRTLAIELATRKIRVNCILAGAIETKMHKEIAEKLSEESLRNYHRKHLLGFGSESDISQMVAYLMSPAGRWITGSMLSIDGGFSAFK